MKSRASPFAVLLVVPFIVPLAAQASPRWEEHVTPNPVHVECKDDVSIPDHQTRDEIARREGIVGRINEIARQIARMQSAGYRSTGGSGGNERFSYDVPLHLSYTRSMRVTAVADDRGVGLRARRMDGRFRGTVPQRAEPYLSPRVKDEIERVKARWRGEATAAFDQLQAQLAKTRYPWSGAELGALSSGRARGGFERNHGFAFCRNGYQLHVRADWRRLIDGPLGK
jgi:hypothetical protein